MISEITFTILCKYVTYVTINFNLTTTQKAGFLLDKICGKRQKILSKYVYYLHKIHKPKFKTEPH